MAGRQDIVSAVVLGAAAAAGAGYGLESGTLAEVTHHAYDANLNIGHYHTLYFNETVCSGGQFSGQVAYQFYRTDSSWHRGPYQGSNRAHIEVAQRNVGQIGHQCNNSVYTDHVGPEDLHPCCFTTGKSGDEYTPVYTQNLPTDWHYLIQPSSYYVSGSCLYTHQTQQDGSPGTVVLKSRIKPPTSPAANTDCN